MTNCDTGGDPAVREMTQCPNPDAPVTVTTHPPCGPRAHVCCGAPAPPQAPMDGPVAQHLACPDAREVGPQPPRRRSRTEGGRPRRYPRPAPGPSTVAFSVAEL
jgi:hypothetical protein